MSMAIIYCPEPKEQMYHQVNYKNILTIQGLLRFYYSLKADLEYKPNFELLCILTDLMNAIKNSGLTTRQAFVLKLYMQGFTEEEIGEKCEITQQGVNKHIKLICNKLSKFLEG